MEKLKQVLAQEDTVLFIGSGISLWSGLPSWTGMIDELAKYVESAGANSDLIKAEAKRGDLLQAASYGFDKLTKQQVGEFIRKTCRYGVSKPHEIHRKIVTLGPRCFVTTNYDNLLEEALRKWQPEQFFRPPITNRQLTETAEIVHARAKDFVFKPHGDAADSDSIILTREQYRQLLPQGERQNVLESVKLLLASRPVVYLGFGLRDPDFLYVRDLLANTYKGGTRDHYAIMTDVCDAETDYWRRNYGIHLVSYPTTLRHDGGRDHTALLALLDSLLEPADVARSPGPGRTASEACTADQVLALARHAARMARMPKVLPEFEIRVHAQAESLRKSNRFHLADEFDDLPVGRFLADGPDRAVLIGLPGAGKTYALGQAAAWLAEKLHDACLSEPFDESSIVIPIFVDLKLYRGDLADLVGKSLPPSLPFADLTRRFRIKLFIDSFNEMPREYWESGSYEGDFAKFTESIELSSLIIGSRTSDGLGKLGFPVYCLDQINDKVVDDELARMGINIEGRFDVEVRRLLQKPFYFQLVMSGAVSLPKEAHPRDFYQSLFANLDHAFSERFGKSFAIEEALSHTAYDAINRGEEAYPLTDLLSVLKRSIESAGLADIDAREIANWLVSTSILIPHIGGRVAFVHQSVTEFLAAKQLAQSYLATPQILKEKLTLTRWDQALFLALSLLPPSQADAFFNDVVSADLSLALNAVKYLEVGRDDVVSKLLTLIPSRVRQVSQFENRIEWLVESILPLSEVHEPQLRDLMKLGDSIGGAAVKRLVEMKGSLIKDELLQELVQFRSDYNYCCNGVGRALKPFAIPEDVRKIVVLADSISNEVMSDSKDEAAHGFINGAAQFLAEMDIAVVRQEFLPSDHAAEVPEIRARVLCEILIDKSLWGKGSTEALELAGDLLLRGVNRAATAICFIVDLDKSVGGLSWTSFSVGHLNRLIAIIDDPEDRSWGLRALKYLCSVRPDLAELVKVHATRKSLVGRAALLYCAGGGDAAPVFEAFRELVKMSYEERMREPVNLLEQVKVNWVGYEALFVQVLKLRDSRIALAIVDHNYSLKEFQLGGIELGPIEWWLNWLDESDPDAWFFLDRMSWLFATCVSKDQRKAFVREFNKSDTKYRAVLCHSILPKQNDLTTDDFSPDAISFLLSELSRSDMLFSWDGHLLGLTATEKFVDERLLPLVPNANQCLLNNLQRVLQQAGSRHGRRYILDCHPSEGQAS